MLGGLLRRFALVFSLEHRLLLGAATGNSGSPALTL
jgi:hypothetical protein